MYDVVIIGAGPIGLYSAYYCGVSNLKTCVLESLSFAGGQLVNLYKDKFIYDIPGFKKITAGDFILSLEEQYEQFRDSVPIYYEQSVKEIQKEDGFFTIKTQNDVFVSKTILIATGAGEFRPRKLPQKNADNFENIHYVSKTEMYKDKNVVIFGGGDSAVDFALMLKDIAKNTSLIHRRNDFRALEHSLELLKNSNVNVLTPYEISEIYGDGNLATGIELKRIETGHEIKLNADYFLVNFGFLPSGVDFATWGVESSKEGIMVDTDASTSAEGVFAIGNCAIYKGKIKTITAGLGEVPIAITSIKRYLNPGKIIGTVYAGSPAK